MWTADGEVDHFLSCSNPRRPENRALAYEWSNLRFASPRMNRRKGTLDEAVLDPYEVQHGWFEVALPDLQLRVSEHCPPGIREKAQFTILRLGLRNDSRIIRLRQHWLHEYELVGDIGILDRHAPLLADAVRRDLATDSPEGHSSAGTIGDEGGQS